MITKICKNPSLSYTLFGAYTNAHILNTLTRTAQSIIQVNEIIENLWGYRIESLWMDRERKRRPQTTRKVCVRVRERTWCVKWIKREYVEWKNWASDDVTFKFIMCWKGLQVVESSKKSAERTSERGAACCRRRREIKKKLQRRLILLFQRNAFDFLWKRCSSGG